MSRCDIKQRLDWDRCEEMAVGIPREGFAGDLHLVLQEVLVIAVAPSQKAVAEDLLLFDLCMISGGTEGPTCGRT